MKKIDKLILSSFLGLFFLTFCVAFFVLLMQFFLLHFDVLIGKGLGLVIYTQLASYVGIVATKQAFPLAVLLSSIIALGNLGEYCELTALKSAGVSLPRVLLPLFCFVLLLSLLVFFSNSYIVPRANLNASSLLYDLTKKKPSVAIKEGVFYDDIPGYSIKVRRKMDDQVTLQGIMIYDHTQDGGAVSLTMAESGKIYTIHDEAYMVIELFNGHSYIDPPPQANMTETHERQIPQFYRSSFESQKLLLSLESFKLARTKKELFSNSYKTKNTQKLASDVVAMKNSIRQVTQFLSTEALNRLIQLDSSELAEATTKPGDLLEIANILELKKAYAKHHHRDKTQSEQPVITADLPPAPSTLYRATDLSCIYTAALKQARTFKRGLALQATETKRLEKEIRKHELERHKMMAWAVSCIVVFLVGAPLGALIKKGGIGIPLIIATCLIVWHYIFEMLGEKWANEDLIDAFSGAWLANSLLLPFGLFFLRQAYKDARLPEAEFYTMLLARIKKYVRKVSNLYGPPRGQ
jgi:lipopolysaccharide export system permease protein